MDSSDRGELVARQIQSARFGDRASLAELLEMYRNYLALLSRSWVAKAPQEKMDSSDLVQDALLKAHEHFEQFRGNTEPEIASWLRRILARCLADSVRRYNQESRLVSRERSLEAMLDESSLALGKILAAGISTPSQAAARRELSVVLADAMADLSSDHRDVIWLRSLQEMDWDEVGRRMNRSARAARMLWTRALQELRPRIAARL